MNTNIPLGRRLAYCAFACSIIPFAPFASAQESDDEVFELSPFTVDVSGDEGWIATNTLTGSRTNQALKNIPLSVDALTTEFLEDMGINTLEDAAFYIAGMDATRQDEGRNDQGLSSFRGMVTGGRENSQSARNNFIWYARSDFYNVERIDFNKGSNSLMFGDTSPGGQASVYTKRAYFRNFGSIYGSYGSYASNRMMLDVNRKISDKIAFRINLVDKADRSFIDFGDDHLRGIHLASTIKATENTTFRFEYESLNYERSRAKSDLRVQQRAAEGRGLSSSSRQYFTSDGDYFDARTRLYYASDGAGGFMEPYTIATEDRRRGSGGDEISLYEGHTETVFDRDGDPLLTLGDIPREVNAYGPRSFQDREVYNYTFILEQRLGDLNLEFATSLQEQYQFRNDNDFDDAINVAGNGDFYNFTNLDQKWFGNDVPTVRLTASYPLKIGENFSQFLVANVTYLDDESYSFRQRMVNKAKAWDPDTQSYDTTVDLEGRERIRVHIEYDKANLVEQLRDSTAWDRLYPENLPNVPGVFEPMWVNYTTANKPYTDKRYSKSASISANGTYFNGKLRSLLGIREDNFALKRYQLPGGSREERVAEFGEIAYWGQDVYVGNPDDFPEFYAYPPELIQTATTYNMGLVYSLTDTLNIYANQATSFRWQGTEDFLGRIIGAVGGKTNEIGLKGSFMDNTFTVTAAYFEIERSNVAFRVSNNNNQGEIERLFNDQFYEIEGDGTIVYVEPEPEQPGYQITGMGLNQEYRQILASESVSGWELNLMMRRTAGLQARLAISHNDIESSRDLTDYEEQVALARARVPVRQAFLDANWANDPNNEEGTYSGFRQAGLDLQSIWEDSNYEGALCPMRKRIS